MNIFTILYAEIKFLSLKGDLNINREKSSSPNRGTGLLRKGFVLFIALTTTGILATTPSVSAQEPLTTPSAKSALINAAQEGNVQKVKELLERDIDVNTKDNNGLTALMAASYNGHSEVVKVLIDRGADINTKDNNGATALSIARKRGHYHIVKLLLEKDAQDQKMDGKSSSTLGLDDQVGGIDMNEIGMKRECFGAEELLQKHLQFYQREQMWVTQLVTAPLPLAGHSSVEKCNPKM